MQLRDFLHYCPASAALFRRESSAPQQTLAVMLHRYDSEPGPGSGGRRCITARTARYLVALRLGSDALSELCGGTGGMGEVARGLIATAVLDTMPETLQLETSRCSVTIDVPYSIRRELMGLRQDI